MGSFGVPRRSWDITGSGAPFAVEFHPAVEILQVGLGVGGVYGRDRARANLRGKRRLIGFLREKTVSADEFKANPQGIPQGLVNLPEASSLGSCSSAGA